MPFNTQKIKEIYFPKSKQHTKNKGNLFSEVKVIGPLLAGLPLKSLYRCVQALQLNLSINTLFSMNKPVKEDKKSSHNAYFQRSKNQNVC